MMPYYAHTGREADQRDWEPLEDHLQQVRDLAGQFAEGFGSLHWGSLAGQLHDLGKYSADFQNYLRRSFADPSGPNDRVDHSSYGAQLASSLGKAGILLAHCIAAHHGGLLDHDKLMDRLAKQLPPLPPVASDTALPEPPPFSRPTAPREAAFQWAVFCRMLFSSLVDADFLATERFMAPDRAGGRIQFQPRMDQLFESAMVHIRQKAARAPDTVVNELRGRVLEGCLAGAALGPGFFSLTVPTGGGKTLSSLAFALSHALRHKLDRVIYVIPFTSIIEQNASVFREALHPWSAAVLEHHSNLDPQKETVWSRLTTENWDARIIVTTNVQLFESLYASRVSSCRKLHRLAGSVIVLDEAQTIPVRVLEPALAVLKQLVANYRCSVVMCTATQPAIHRRPEFPIGIDGVREIIGDIQALHIGLKRVQAQFLGKMDDAQLLSRLAACRQALCIVNTRQHARGLFQTFPEPARCMHLSALMCPEHRTRQIQLIRQRLQASAPCVVISTQLVEAGVDLDFPVVYRAVAGLDSIAQAAGRCNREGRLAHGEVFIFEPECGVPRGDQRLAADSGLDVIGRFPDLLSLEAVEEYFRLHYWRRSGEWDAERVMECFNTGQAGPCFDFEKAAERFCMIPERPDGAVIVPYGERGRELHQLITTTAPESLPPDIHRRSQRFLVQIPRRVWDALVGRGAIALYGPGDSLPLLMNADLYDEQLGLDVSKVLGMDAESLIV